MNNTVLTPLYGSLLKRCLLAALCISFLSGTFIPVLAENFNLGHRYDRYRNGHGLEMHRVGDTYVVYLYTYQPDGSPDWFLCVGDMINAVVQGVCRHFRYQPDAEPPLQQDTIAQGSFTLDFAAANDARACNDGKTRDNAEQLAVFGWSSQDEYVEWCTEFLRIGADYPQRYYGGAWYGGDTDGYGCTMSNMDETLTALCYYYDGDGQSRWALGVGSTDESTIPLVHYEGFCRECPVVDLIGTDIGSLVLDLDEGSEPGSGSDRATLSLRFAVGPPGSFEREFPLLLLTDGSQAGSYNIPTEAIQTEAQIAAWRSDLDLFSAQLREIHPNPFHGVNEEVFNGSLASLSNRLPYLRDDQFAVEVAKTAALISRQGRDGHTNAVRLDSTGLPLQFYLFSDGVYIVDALPPYQGLIGSRVTHIGNADIKTVLERVDVGVPRDNEFSAKWIMGLVLVLTDVYSGLGLIDDRLHIPVNVVNTVGVSVKSIIEPISLEVYSQWKEFGPNTLPSRSTLYLSNTEQAFWLTMLEDSGTLYMQYNHVFAVDAEGQTITQFSASLEDAVNNPDVKRLVIDLRHNNGGDNTTYGPLIDLLSNNEAINRPDYLYVIAGRQTFSAAMNFAADVENRTQALFVGEGTGGSPQHYGDAEVVFLQNSAIQLNISSRNHPSSIPNDQRLSILPDIAVGLTSLQYFGDIDPALDLIVNLP